MKKIALLLLLNSAVILQAVAQTFGVQSFTLVDWRTDLDVRTMKNPDTTFGAFYDYNIRANTYGDVGSVRFEYKRILTGTSWSRIENEAPYSLGGDDNGDYFSWWTIPGDYLITATPYSGDNATGTKGKSLTIKQVVLYNPNPPVILSFTLVDPLTDTDIRQLKNNDTIYAGRSLNIRVNTDHDYGTIKINFGTYYSITEIWPPFAVGGDDGGNYNNWYPREGTHVLTAIPYSERYGVEGIKGMPVSITLTVLPPSIGTRMGITGNSVASTLYPNPVKDELKISFASSERAERIEITDVTGTVFMEAGVTDDIQRLDLSTLTPGIYFAIVTSARGREVYKFVKE